MPIAKDDCVPDDAEEEGDGDNIDELLRNFDAGHVHPSQLDGARETLLPHQCIHLHTVYYTSALFTMHTIHHTLYIAYCTEFTQDPVIALHTAHWQHNI